MRSRRGWTTLRLGLLGAALSLLAAASPARAAQLRAGVAAVEITPAVGTPLGGYAGRFGKASTGVHDPIMAKALVLDDGTTRLAVVTTDLVGTNPEMTRRVATESGIPADRLMICASHTHSGPGAYGKPPFAVITLGAYRQEVFDRLTAGIVRALKEAQEGLRPAAIAVGESRLPRFSRNRRGARLRDPALWLMRVDAVDGKPMAVMVNLNAHGTVLTDKNLEFSGDWMAFTQAYLEKELPGVKALYANGAVGDISPNIPDNSSHFEGAKAHGEMGGVAALELYRTLKPSREVTLEVRAASLTLPESRSAALIGAGKETRLQLFRVNNSLLIAVPGEMIVQLGLALKEHARAQGHALPVIMGLANDHLGYFLTRAEMKKGGYESTVSFFGEAFGEELTLALARLIGGDVSALPERFRPVERPEPDRSDAQNRVRRR